MRIYEFEHINSFTNEMFGGNPTVAVLHADTLSEDEMQKIARQMNLSETSFMLSSKIADFQLRYFTPQKEVKFCGHATVGALAAIAKRKLFNCTKDRKFFTIETQIGNIKAEIALIPDQAPQYIMDSPKIELVPAPYKFEDVMEALGISKDLIDLSKPLMLEKTNNYLYLTARNLDCLGKIKLDVEKATQFAQKDNIVVFCILTNETFDRSNNLHARGFAPLVGVPEDPFTGSMQGGLAAYAINQGMLPKNQKQIRVEQGHFMKRPGFVTLEIANADPIQVRLHSEATPVFAAKLELSK